MPRRAPITREEYEARAGENIALDRWTKPEVRPVTIRGVPVLVKDFGRRPPLWRGTLGRIVIAREVSIYRALAGLCGIPRYFGQIDHNAFVIERIHGRDASEFKKGCLPDDFLPRLKTIVLAMHERGVVHWDLRQRKNIIVADDGSPWIIDFASGFRLPRGSQLLKLACVADLSGVAKLKAKHRPEDLDDEDRRLLNIERFRPFRIARKKMRLDRRAKRKAAREERQRRERCRD